MCNFPDSSIQIITSNSSLIAKTMRYFLFSLFSLLSFSVFAAPPVTVTPIVKEVTVYRSGARIAATGKVKVPAGRSEVIFENLSASFNGNSLQVQTPNGVRLFSAAFQVKTPAPVAENPRIQVLRDSLVLLNDSLYALRSETQVYAQERNLVEKNITQTGMLIPGVNGVKMAVE